MTSLSNRLLGLETRPCVQSESHSYSLKCSKSSGIDGISAEHFVFAHSRIHVLLSLLFSAFVMHGYLPSMFMKIAIVPIIKTKTGDTSDKNNYWPIALVTAA